MNMHAKGNLCIWRKMVICEGVMKDRMLPGDEMLNKPSDGDGGFLEINFRFLRKRSSGPEERNQEDRAERAKLLAITTTGEI